MPESKALRGASSTTRIHGSLRASGRNRRWKVRRPGPEVTSGPAGPADGTGSSTSGPPA